MIHVYLCKCSFSNWTYTEISSQLYPMTRYVFLTRLQSFSLPSSTSSFTLSILSSCSLSSIIWISVLSFSTCSWSFCRDEGRENLDIGTTIDIHNWTPTHYECRKCSISDSVFCSRTAPQQCAADSASPGTSGLFPLSGPGWNLQAEGSVGPPEDEPDAVRPGRDPSGQPLHSDHSSSPLQHARLHSDVPAGCASPSVLPHSPSGHKERKSMCWHHVYNFRLLHAWCQSWKIIPTQFLFLPINVVLEVVLNVQTLLSMFMMKHVHVRSHKEKKQHYIFRKWDHVFPKQILAPGANTSPVMLNQTQNAWVQPKILIQTFLPELL